jgi:hypothetical protein
MKIRRHPDELRESKTEQMERRRRKWHGSNKLGIVMENFQLGIFNGISPILQNCNGIFSINPIF